MELQNEIWLENQYEALQVALDEQDWTMARNLVKEAEDNGFNSSELRRVMNLAMAGSCICNKNGFGVAGNGVYVGTGHLDSCPKFTDYSHADV